MRWLVARERELAEARALWRKAHAGEGGLLLVSGEPGIGKTRLAWALLDPEAAREHNLRAAELDRQRGDILSELFDASNAALRSLELGGIAAVEEGLPSLWQLLDAVVEPGMMTKGVRELEAMLL